MKSEEAIEILERKKKYSERVIDDFLDYSSGEIKDAEQTIEMCDIAISALKEVQRYREIGTVEEFRKTADRNNQKQPVWKNGRSTIFKDYVDGHGEAEENKWADWVCPECGWFVGEQYLPRQHNQSKCNFCPKCGQAIRWEN